MPAPLEPDLTTYSGKLAFRLRELRLLREISVEELVEKINRFGYEVKVGSYRQWERNHATVKIDALPYIAKALGVESVYEFFPKLETKQSKK